MIKRLRVNANGMFVGTLAMNHDGEVAFQYSEEWLKNGFSLNPIKLPLINEVFIATSPYFRGLFGVFADSLPDSYGELLLDRFLRQKGIDLASLSPLDRLAYVGSRGMGILEYVPDYSEEFRLTSYDFDYLQKECDALLDAKEVEDIRSLYALGGSSGGARPKSLIRYENEDWIVKFSAKFDPKNIGDLEYKTMSLAKKAGISVPEIRLVTSSSGNRYFLIKRFDRDNKKKIHMITAAALLECDFRAPALDYVDLLKLTRVLTADDADVIEMFRRMVFNVLAGNQDDHAKNFAFLYDEADKKYRLAPAYDITPSKTFYGEHTTSVNGKGKDIGDAEMLVVAEKSRIPRKTAESIIASIKKVLK